MNCQWCPEDTEAGYIAAFGSADMEVWSVLLCQKHAHILAAQGESAGEENPVFAPDSRDQYKEPPFMKGRPWAIAWDIRRWTDS